MGGNAVPTAFTIPTNVTNSPHSADAAKLTCFFPLAETILTGFKTVVTPVSSTLNIRSGSKNSETHRLLKPVALAKLVLSPEAFP
jgi:hypothetical protein